jgi:hypothetical protein
MEKTQISSGDPRLTIDPLGEPGPGGAHSDYVVSWGTGKVRIPFQTMGTERNGLTNEALMAILIDRLQSFQDGPFPCEENAAALAHQEHALEWLKKRTRGREVRGVEGKNEP